MNHAKALREARAYEEISLVDYAALLSGDVENYHDADGRPIGESRACAEARRGVVTEYRTCPYSGSRSQHVLPMNVTALRQTGRDWGAVLGALSAVREAYMARHAITALNLVHYWRMVSTATFLPAYYLFRAEDPYPSGKVPPFAGSIHKMMVGIHSVCSNLTLLAVSEGRPLAEVLITPEMVYQASEEMGTLIGPEEVCAGTQAMIEEVLGVLSHGVSKTAPNRAPITSTIHDWPSFLDYAAAGSDVSLAAFVMALRFDRALVAIGELVEAHDGVAPGIGASLDETRLERFLKHYVQRLDRLGVEPLERLRLAEGVLPLIQADASVILGEPSEDATSDEAARLLARLVHEGAAQDHDPVLVSALTHELARHLDAERRALTVFEPLQHEINRALGRRAPSRAPLGSDLSALFGRTATDFFESAFGVAIRNDRAGATLHAVPPSGRAMLSRPDRNDGPHATS